MALIREALVTLPPVAEETLEREPIGAKKRDYWWTVLFTDPIALPLVRFLARHRWLSPDAVSLISALLGAAVGPVFALGTRWGLVVGAVLFQLAFVTDCVDGKLARALEVTGPRGEKLDRVGDATRRISGTVGLIVYLFRAEDAPKDAFWLAVAYAAATFYFIELSGGSEVRQEAWFKSQPGSVRQSEPGGWSRALARRRLLPTPGMPDVQAVVFVLGPLTGLVVPALIAGLVMLGGGILVNLWRLLR